MTLAALLIVALLVLIVGALPTWGYSKGWGWAPSGSFGLVLAIVAVLLLMGRT